MATKDLLSSHFEDFGFDLTETMIEKCVDLCISYRVDPKEFVEIFVAFCINNLNGADATESTLDDFERKELMSNKSKAKASNKAARSMNDFAYDDIGSDGEDNDVMGNYICTTPKTNKPRRSLAVSTPVSALKINEPMDSPVSVSVPLTDFPGKVVYTFGTSQLIKSIEWTNTGKQPIKFERISEHFGADQTYMYDNLLQKTSIAADRIFDIGEEICTKLIKERGDVYENDLYNQVFKVNAPTQAAIRCVGRICSDSDCQLDLHSTMLISADEICLRSYRLQFDRMKSFALFPGQTVFMQGVNPRGDTFFVDEIIGERNLTYAEPPQVATNLNLIVAAGPYTSQDDLTNDALNDLIVYCKQNKPDVLILLGPFLDADHPLVLDGSMKMSMETFFEHTILRVMNSIGVDTEVFVISSHQDVHSTFVYPTAPYAPSQNLSFKNLTFLPDPCVVKINGVTIGITATDIYNHILDSEIAVNAGDRVKRVANHLFNQASFYPLNPPSDKVSVDSGLAQQFASLSIVPNILILKSNAKYFAREVINERGCLILNPGSMYENAGKGTFSRLVVTPSTEDKTALNSIIGCQIIKI